MLHRLDYIVKGRIDKMKFQTQVSAIGELAMELVQDANSLVLFDDQAPEELQEISVVHPTTELAAPIQEGDTLYLSNYCYRVIKVGDEANHTLKTSGHCTIVFDPEAEEILPGQIVVAGMIPQMIQAGDSLSFE